jgi:hypothetical protein
MSIETIGLLIAILTLIVALISLYWKYKNDKRGMLKEKLENTPMLKVIVENGTRMTTDGSIPTQKIINLRTVNVGKRPITISSFGFEFENKISNQIVFASLELPKKLEEAESHSFHIMLNDFKNELKKRPPESQMPKYAWVRDHTGIEYKSENISEISTVYNALKLD